MTDHINEIRLVGRVSQVPEERVLPSGDSVWAFRLIVHRPPNDHQAGVSVDAIECAVWTGRPRRSVATWKANDLVEVSGALRRRFFRQAGGAASRIEVEVHKAKILKRPKEDSKS